MAISDKNRARSFLGRTSALAIIAASLTVCTAAHATEAPASVEAQPTGSNADPASEAIVVVGSKFGRELSKAPVSAVSISQTDLTKNNILTAADIAVRVPSLNYTTPFGYAQAYIRGVGTDFSLAGLEAPIATYVDGFYIQRQLGASLSLVDLKGVDVLNGPQGTLYGRNATGGAIVLTTADPGDTLGGRIEAQYGSFDQHRLFLALDLPISDTLKVRLVGQETHVGDYLDGIPSTVLPEPERGGNADTTYARLKVKWTPSPNFTATYAFDYARSKAGTNTRQVLDDPYCTYCTFVGLDPKKGGFYTQTDGPGTYSRTRYFTQNLNLRYEADSFDISSTTGWRSQNTPVKDTEVDLPGGLFFAAYGEKGPNIQNDTFIRTKFDSPFNFLLGAFFMREHNKVEVEISGTLFDPFKPVYGNDVLVSTQAVYGELYYTMQKFKLTAGFRWSQDYKRTTGFYDADTALVFGIGTTGGGYTQSKKFPQLTPKAVLEYNFTDTALAYASYNRGFRSGGFQGPSPAPSDPVASEKIDSYEIGIKGRYFDNRLTLNIAGFYEKYRDIQVTVSDAQSGTILVKNAASAEIKGVEVSFDAKVTTGLQISGGMSFLDNKFKSFANARVYGPYPDAFYAGPNTGPGSNTGLAQITEDLSGHVMPNSPKFSGNLAVDYTVPVKDWSLHANILANYTSSYEFTVGAGGPLRTARQNSYGKVNASIDATLPNGKTTIGVFATNITGTHYRAASNVNATGAWYIAPVRPSVFVRMRQEF